MASGRVTALTGRTHGRTDQFCVREESPCQLGAVHTWGKADMGCRMVPIISAASDPRRTLVGLRSRSAAVLRCAIVWDGSTGAGLAAPHLESE
jgi:hypothetical protein